MNVKVTPLTESKQFYYKGLKDTFELERGTTNNALISSLLSSGKVCGLLIFYCLDPNYAGHKVELDLDSN